MTHDTTSLRTHAQAVSWTPAGYDGRVHAGALLGAVLPALAILMVAAAFLVINS